MSYLNRSLDTELAMKIDQPPDGFPNTHWRGICMRYVPFWDRSSATCSSTSWKRAWIGTEESQATYQLWAAELRSGLACRMGPSYLDLTVANGIRCLDKPKPKWRWRLRGQIESSQPQTLPSPSGYPVIYQPPKTASCRHYYNWLKNKPGSGLQKCKHCTLITAGPQERRAIICKVPLGCDHSFQKLQHFSFPSHSVVICLPLLSLLLLLRSTCPVSEK